MLMFGGIPEGGLRWLRVAPGYSYTYANVGGNGDWSDIFNSVRSGDGAFGANFDFSPDIWRCRGSPLRRSRSDAWR